jgi:hypothetical protein
MQPLTAQENDSAPSSKDPNPRQKMRPVGFEPTSPGPFPGVILYSTMVSVTEGGFDPPTFGLHLAIYEPNAIPLCYSVYAPRGDTFENGKALESIFRFFCIRSFISFIQKLNPSALWLVSPHLCFNAIHFVRPLS